MKINEIKFIVSVSNNIYCSKCFKPIETKNGFIRIRARTGRNNDLRKSDICLECFNEFLENKKIYEKNKNKIYNEMVKKRVLKGLKK